MAINPDTLRSERELHSFLLGVTDEQTRALTESWVRAWDSVSAELEAALSDLSAATTSGRVTRTQILRSARLQAALAATEDVLGTVARATNDTIVADLWSVVSAGAEHEHEMIASQLSGVKRAELQAGLIRADPGQISAMVERSTAQITALTLPLAPQTYSAIKTELLQGIAVGANPRTAARRMVSAAEDKMNFGLSRALNIARTEMLDANRAAALAVDKANTKVLAGWTWMAHLDANTCRSCVAMHGSLHEIEEPGPYDHQSGRCARVPKTKSWEELGFKGISEPPDSIPSADAFFDRLSDKQKRSMLGAKGYDAWKAGRYPRSSWSTRRSTDGWRDSFVPSAAPS